MILWPPGFIESRLPLLEQLSNKWGSVWIHSLALAKVLQLEGVGLGDHQLKALFTKLKTDKIIWIGKDVEKNTLGLHWKVQGENSDRTTAIWYSFGNEELPTKSCSLQQSLKKDLERVEENIDKNEWLTSRPSRIWKQDAGYRNLLTKHWKILRNTRTHNGAQVDQATPGLSTTDIQKLEAAQRNLLIFVQCSAIIIGGSATTQGKGGGGEEEEVVIEAEDMFSTGAKTPATAASKSQTQKEVKHYMTTIPCEVRRNNRLLKFYSEIELEIKDLSSTPAVSEEVLMPTSPSQVSSDTTTTSSSSSSNSNSSSTSYTTTTNTSSSSPSTTTIDNQKQKQNDGILITYITTAHDLKRRMIRLGICCCKEGLTPTGNCRRRNCSNQKTWSSDLQPSTVQPRARQSNTSILTSDEKIKNLEQKLDLYEREKKAAYDRLLRRGGKITDDRKSMLRDGDGSLLNATTAYTRQTYRR